MPTISAFFGVIIRMYYDEHDPPHIHVEYQGRAALIDFAGNVLRGDLRSRTATRLVRDWIDLHVAELDENWAAARRGHELRPIEPLE